MVNKKKKRKNLKKSSRLFLLLFLLFSIAITLSTATYAWFSSNKIATVWLMDVQVAAQNGIEISADAIKWDSEVTIEQLQDAHLTYSSCKNQLPVILEPVSTVGDVENGLMKMFYGKVENAKNSSSKYTLRTNRLEEKNGYGEDFDGKFIAFDVFIKTNNPTELYLTNESGITYSGEESVGIENSMRYAFVVEGNAPTTTDISTVQNLKTGSKSNVHIWEPNYNLHTESAIKNADNVYGITVGSDSAPLKYEGVKAEISKDDGVYIDTANKKNYPNYFDTVNVEYTSKANFNDFIQIFNVEAGITKIRVYVWIEGQDVDCENDAAYGGMLLNLQFTTNPS